LVYASTIAINQIGYEFLLPTSDQLEAVSQLWAKHSQHVFKDLPV